MPWPDEATNTDLSRLVAAAADLCRKPLRHGVVLTSSAGDEDCSLRLEARSPEGERQPADDLELELYRSGGDLHLTLAWREDDSRPMLWQGGHPLWMTAAGARCPCPPEGLPLEALARRLRALLAPGA
ncbi:MAG: hypothetical protein ACK59A_06935 [Cyanobacteriota bacterium]|jgi:hypothetical protein